MLSQHGIRCTEHPACAFEIRMGMTLVIALAALLVLQTLGAVFCFYRERARRVLAERDAADCRVKLVEIQELARIGNWEFDLVNDQIRWSAETFQHLWASTRFGGAGIR